VLFVAPQDLRIFPSMLVLVTAWFGFLVCVGLSSSKDFSVSRRSGPVFSSFRLPPLVFWCCCLALPGSPHAVSSFVGQHRDFPHSRFALIFLFVPGALRALDSLSISGFPQLVSQSRPGRFLLPKNQVVPGCPKPGLRSSRPGALADACVFACRFRNPLPLVSAPGALLIRLFF
jgi:hypothetical protein